MRRGTEFSVFYDIWLKQMVYFAHIFKEDMSINYCLTFVFALSAIINNVGVVDLFLGQRSS